MKKRIMIFFAAFLCLCGCGASKSGEEVSDALYQVNLLQSLTLGSYDGAIEVSELLKHGDTGIGTFDGVNGEMIVLDGVVYQALSDSSVIIAADDETVPFANVTFIDADICEEKIAAENMADLKEILKTIVDANGNNQFYMIRLDGEISKICVRSEEKQEKPYRPLDEVLLEAERRFDYTDTEGTIVGLYCPSYMDGLNTPGWHFHYISKDRTKGGHILSFEDFTGSLKMDQISEFKVEVENTDNFNELNLGEDQSERINSVEKGK